MFTMVVVSGDGCSANVCERIAGVLGWVLVVGDGIIVVEVGCEAGWGC